MVAAASDGRGPPRMAGRAAARSRPARRLALSRQQRRPHGPAQRRRRACAGTTPILPARRGSGTTASRPEPGPRGEIAMSQAEAEAQQDPPDAARTGAMVFIPGGTFRMGSDHHYPEEAPAHRVSVDGFWIDRTPVTNRQFKQFVNATGHVTEAQIVPDPKDYPGALKEMLYAGSLVFSPLPRITDLTDWSQWWSFLRGANWRHPYGPGSNIKGLDDHPVVHVSYSDAAAYARWAGKDLPTEAEWEFAARGGLEAEEFAWGDELTPAGRHMANTWQGEFPC